MEDVLQRRAVVRRDAIALESCLTREARGGEHQSAREPLVIELAERDDVAPRHDEHVEWRRLRPRIEGHDVLVLEPDRLSLLLVRRDPAEDAPVA
jgi:hypothetical protein